MPTPSLEQDVVAAFRAMFPGAPQEGVTVHEVSQKIINEGRSVKERVAKVLSAAEPTITIKNLVSRIRQGMWKDV